MMQSAQPHPTSASTHNSRINLAELKSQLVKRIGIEETNRYFSYLHGLLSHSLSKPDFNKFCLVTLGRENLPLHNQLIRAILRNAYQAKSPPSFVCDKDVSKPGVDALKNCFDTEDGVNSLRDPALPFPIWSNGDILPPSTCKLRDGQNQKINNHLSSIRSNGRVDVSAPYNGVVPKESGDLYDLKRTVEYQQGQAAEQSAKRSRMEKLSLHDQGSVRNKSLVEVVAARDREDAEHQSRVESCRVPVQAPLGIPFCSVSIGGARKSAILAGNASSLSCSSVSDCRELSHTEVLKKRIEKIVEDQGLAGVTMDCANLLNIGLDVYLKRLITSCVELRGSRAGCRSLKQPDFDPQLCGKPINGEWVRNQIQVQNSGGTLEGVRQAISSCIITRQDFNVAMELDPQQLGEDWPLLLEKTCIRSFEE